MIAEVMRWCDEQLTIDHNLVPTTPAVRSIPPPHLHPDWFTALLLCGKNSLLFTKLSCPYSSNMHSFISSSLNWKAMLNKAKKMFAQCLKISQKVSFYVIRSEETKINVRIYFLARKFKYLTYLWYQGKNWYFWVIFKLCFCIGMIYHKT